MPILLRVALLLLFIWYCFELLLRATTPQAKLFVSIVAVLIGMTFLLVMIFTYGKYPWRNDAGAGVSTGPLWPFLLINALMILLVAAIGQWAHWQNHCGLLGFTQHWVQKIGALLTGGSQ
jgi:hypothetical protein